MILIGALDKGLALAPSPRWIALFNALRRIVGPPEYHPHDL